MARAGSGSELSGLQGILGCVLLMCVKQSLKWLEQDWVGELGSLQWIRAASCFIKLESYMSYHRLLENSTCDHKCCPGTWKHVAQRLDVLA